MTGRQGSSKAGGVEVSTCPVSRLLLLYSVELVTEISNRREVTHAVNPKGR